MALLVSNCPNVALVLKGPYKGYKVYLQRFIQKTKRWRAKLTPGGEVLKFNEEELSIRQ